MKNKRFAILVRNNPFGLCSKLEEAMEKLDISWTKHSYPVDIVGCMVQKSELFWNTEYYFTCSEWKKMRFQVKFAATLSKYGYGVSFLEVVNEKVRIFDEKMLSKA